MIARTKGVGLRVTATVEAAELARRDYGGRPEEFRHPDSSRGQSC